MKLPITERETLSLELARAREAAGVSQGAVAREAGVSRSWIGFVENCGPSALPSRHLLTVYARLCRLDAQDLLCAWRYPPEDVIILICQNPALCEMIRKAA